MNVAAADLHPTDNSHVRVEYCTYMTVRVHDGFRGR